MGAVRVRPPGAAAGIPWALAVAILATWPAGAWGTDLTLRWTAPGDDGAVGRAVEYDLRYLSVPITAANFATAIKVPGLPAPAPGGTTEVYTARGLLPFSSYYFALRARDETGNWSSLSNVAELLLALESAGGSATLDFSTPRPSPARSSTMFTLSLSAPADVSAIVFDLMGRRVRTLLTGWLPAGEARVVWPLDDDDGRRVPPGVYLVRAQLGASAIDRRVVVVR